MTLPIRKVRAAGWSRYSDSMGTIVSEGYMTKVYIPNRSDPDAPTIEWTLNDDAPFAVDNGIDSIIQPGESVQWEK